MNLPEESFWAALAPPRTVINAASHKHTFHGTSNFHTKLGRFLKFAFCIAAITTSFLSCESRGSYYVKREGKGNFVSRWSRYFIYGYELVYTFASRRWCLFLEVILLMHGVVVVFPCKLTVITCGNTGAELWKQLHGGRLSARHYELPQKCVIGRQLNPLDKIIAA